LLLGVCAFASLLPYLFNAEPGDAKRPYNVVHDPRTYQESFESAIALADITARRQSIYNVQSRANAQEKFTARDVDLVLDRPSA
jgi:hypothetical protein